MVLEGECIIKYTLDRVQKEIVAEVKLEQIDELGKPFQNIWEGKAWLNGDEFKHPSLQYCVNAQYSAEKIAWNEIERLKIKYKKEGKSFRIKRKTDDSKRKSTKTKRVPASKKRVPTGTKKVGRPKSR